MIIFINMPFTCLFLCFTLSEQQPIVVTLPLSSNLMAACCPVVTVRTGATRLLANGVCEESATEGIWVSLAAPRTDSILAYTSYCVFIEPTQVPANKKRSHVTQRGIIPDFFVMLSGPIPSECVG
jgi:hypothetical protein